MLLHEILAFNRRRRGGARALLTEDGRTLTFAELYGSVRRTLRLGDELR